MFLHFLSFIFRPYFYFQSRNLEAIAWYYVGFICGIFCIPVLVGYGLYWSGEKIAQVLGWIIIMAIFTVAKPSWAWATARATFCRRNQFVSTF